jgi:1-acyl-sn-glycerol-3-phosphate acyltransferase
MLRSAYLVCMGFLITAFTTLFILAGYPVFPHGEYTVHRIARIWGRVCLYVSGVEVRVEGAENVLRETPQIIMANHQSWFDIFIMLAHVPVPFSWLAKKELFHIPAFGTALRKLGVIAIDRKNRPDAVRSLEAAAGKIREGKSVVTFPEGTRSMDASIQPFKKGVFHLALEAGVPIVPVSIVGSHEIMSKRSFRIRPGKVRLVIGEPIRVADYDAGSMEELVARTRDEIMANYKRARQMQTAGDEG